MADENLDALCDLLNDSDDDDIFNLVEEQVANIQSEEPKAAENGDNKNVAEMEAKMRKMQEEMAKMQKELDRRRYMGQVYTGKYETWQATELGIKTYGKWCDLVGWENLTEQKWKSSDDFMNLAII